MKIPISNPQAWYRLLLVCFLSGCTTGLGVWQPFQQKPYTYFHGGEQFGRDQMINRRLIAMKKAFIKGKTANEVLSILGQPQEIRTIEQNISQDWYFIYYKKYLPYVDNITQYTFEPRLTEGTFIVRVRHNRVIDVVHLN